MGEGEKEKNLLKHFLFDGTPAFSTLPKVGTHIIQRDRFPLSRE